MAVHKLTDARQAQAAAITAALESLGAGDQREATAILVNALEGVGHTRKLLCPNCGLDCEWPGRLEEHILNVHWDEGESARAAA